MTPKNTLKVFSPLNGDISTLLRIKKKFGRILTIFILKNEVACLSLSNLSLSLFLSLCLSLSLFLSLLLSSLFFCATDIEKTEKAYERDGTLYLW